LQLLPERLNTKKLEFQRFLGRIMKKLFFTLVALATTCALAQTNIAIAVYPDLDSHLAEVLPGFEEAHPDINVEVRVLEHGDHHNNLITNLATGSGAADVVAIDVGFIARFVAEGGLTDLSQAPFNASEIEDLFAPYAWLQASTTDGRQVAIPTDLGPGVMYYRRDHLSETGADIGEVTGSWDSFLEYGRQVTQDTDGDGQTDVYLIADAADVARAMFRSNLGEGEGIFYNQEATCWSTRPVFKKRSAWPKPSATKDGRAHRCLDERVVRRL
jgi:multiple sugar transport system substrate-binding protein